MNDFITIFVIPRNTEAYIPILIIASLVTIAISVAEVILRKKGKGIFPWATSTMPPTFGIVVGSILLIGYSAILIYSIVQSNRLVSAYKNGEYDIAEGIVHVLHTQPRGGHDKGDIVRIGNDEFVIDYHKFTVGYDLTITNGGVLKDGIYARVYHKKGIIMRIDIPKAQD